MRESNGNSKSKSITHCPIYSEKSFIELIYFDYIKNTMFLLLLLLLL